MGKWQELGDKVYDVLVRASRTGIQVWLGIVTAGMTNADGAMGINILPSDFADLAWTAAKLAVAPVVLSVAQNLLEILNGLDVSKPRMRG